VVVVNAKAATALPLALVKILVWSHRWTPGRKSSL